MCTCAAYVACAHVSCDAACDATVILTVMLPVMLIILTVIILTEQMPLPMMSMIS